MGILQAWQRPAAVGLLALAMVACSDNEITIESGTPTSTVGGVAAIGAPIVGGEVDLQCGSAVTRSAITDTTGTWSTTVPTAALPCAARVTGGSAGGAANPEVFYSFTQSQDANQVLNLTPLTSLGVAHAVQGSVGGDLATWFARADLGDTLQQVNSAMASAQTAMNAALSGAGYVLPGPAFNAFSAPFTAAVGNPHDDLLESLAEALRFFGGSYGNMLASFVSGGALPAALTRSPNESIAYDGQNYVPLASEASYRYQTEACAGAYNVLAGGFAGLATSLRVRVGMLKPENGSVELDVAALTPGVGTLGPVAPGKVQLYLFLDFDNQSWTGAASQGKVKIDFDGSKLRVRGSDIVLENGKKIGFDLSATYIEAEVCQPPPSRVQKAVDAAKALAGDYPVRLYGASCAAPLQATSSAFSGTLRIGSDGSFTVVSAADPARSVAITPMDEGFTVPETNGYDYTLHYLAGDRQIRVMYNDNHVVPTAASHIQLVEVRAGDGCQAFLKRGMEEVTADAGTGSAEEWGNGNVAALTLKGARETFAKSVLNGGTYEGPGYADGRFSFGAEQFLAGSTTEGKPGVRFSIANLPSAPGKYACTSFYEMRISVTLPAASGSGTTNYSSGGAGTCTVEILEADFARKKVRGRFSATLTGFPGNEAVTVSDGYFYFAGY